MDDKIKAAASILYLCFSVENMDEIIRNNESLIGALTRTLRENYKKNLDLTMYLLNIFYAYSNFTEYHPFLVQNCKIGDTCIIIIEYEIKRYKTRVKEYMTKQKILQRALKSPSPDADVAELQKEVKKEEKRLAITIKKQEKVLFVAIHLLLNIAEDLQIERKMKSRSIVDLLMCLTERNNPDLIYIALNFLKKLSVFGDNKNLMIDLDVVTKINRFIPCQNPLLAQISLRVLFNLSFDPEVKQKISAIGMIPKLVELLKVAQYRSILLRILYHLSSEDKLKNTFAYTACIPLVYKLIIHFPEPIVGKELIALAINLTTDSKCSEIISANDQLEELIKRAFKSQDTLLFRVVRNIA